ncbi:UNVERIFIED_CONTAM: hypothetical protein K2H54_040513 [Gekko kuhli]
MRGLLLGAVLAIACWPDIGAGVPVQPDFDPQQFAGQWYAAAIVKSNGRPEHILVLDHTVEALTNGDLLMRARIPVKYTCKEEEIHLVHTDRPGIFTTNTEHVLSVVEADYGSYYILHVETPENSILQLFARKSEVPIMAENMYLSRVRSLGFDLKLIFYLDTIDRCS